MSQVVPEIADRKEVFENYIHHLHLCAQSKPDLSACQDTSAQVELKLAVDSFSSDFDKFIYINTPYNELFADVVAALASGQRDIMALHMGPCTNSDPACEYRAFSKNTLDKFAGENAYSRFSPLRRDFWQGWVTPRLDDKPRLLAELSLILVTESYANWSDDYVLIEGMSALKQNKRLRDLLKLTSTGSATLDYALTPVSGL